MANAGAPKPMRPATSLVLAVNVCTGDYPGQLCVLGMPPPPQPSGRNRSPPECVRVVRLSKIPTAVIRPPSYIGLVPPTTEPASRCHFPLVFRHIAEEEAPP